MAAQQSWTDWLLGRNTAISNTATASSLNDGNSPTAQSTPNNTQPSASSSPYGPYVRTGRGGAGNFTWQSQPSSQGVEDNLESQKPSTLSERRKVAANVEHHDTDNVLKTKAAQKPVSEYVRVGRGFVHSSELQQSPQSSENDKQIPIPSSISNPRVAHPGRGGAGNYAVAAELNEDADNERQQREQLAAEQRRGQIEEQLRDALPAPPDAWTGGRRRSLDPPEERP